MNAALDFQIKLLRKISNIKRYIKSLPREAGNVALFFFNEQFKKQSTPEDQKWKQRKDGDTTRNLLVKSGRLRKSIRILRKTTNSVTIGTNVPYAKYHNEGTARIPQRKFLGPSAILSRRIERMIKVNILRLLRS
jgi:phage gpG-like protein